MTKIPREEQEYHCEDCGCEMSYYAWLEHSGQTDNEGICQDCWEEFIDNLFEDDEKEK
jgi:hypothetical protein